MTQQDLPNTENSTQTTSLNWGAAVTIGFGSAIWMWMLAWVLHLPGMKVSPTIAIPLLMLPLLVVGLLWLPKLPAESRIMTGAAAGLIAGIINLLILGSNIVEQPETTAEMSEQANALAPNAMMVIFGSIALSMIVGLIAGVISKGRPDPAANLSSQATWITRFAKITALTYLPLIAVGGAVTSTDSGLAVPDGFTSYGAVSVLFPLKLMAEPRIFLEHSHRLFGTLAGITTIVLMVRVLINQPRKLPKALSTLLFIGVSLQGYMGYIRVAESSTFFAIIHGIFAQLIFALAFILAIILSDKWTNAKPSEETQAIAKKARTMITLMMIALVIQLALGAVTRHLNSSHAMMSHMGFAFIAMMLVIVGGALCMRTGKTDDTGKPIRIFGSILHGLIVLQFTLGFAVLGLAWEGDDASALPTSDELAIAAPIETLPSLMTTSHHVIGALVLAAGACALVWSFKLASKRAIQ